MSNEIVSRELEGQARAALAAFIKKHVGNITKVMPQFNPERTVWLIYNAIRRTPKLVECKPDSFINAVLLASNIGLEIRAGSAYLIPYGQECQLVVDYRGMIDVAARAGVVIHPPQLIHERDEFDEWTDENGHHLKFRRAKGERGEVVGGFVMAEHTGRRIFLFMDLSEIEAIRHRSQNGRAKQFKSFGHLLPGLPTLADVRAKAALDLSLRDPYRMPWVVDWDRMAEKSLVRRMFNRVPQTDQMRVAAEVADAEDMGTQVVAPEMAELVFDPDDTRPLVDTESARALLESKLTEATGVSAEDRARLEEAVERLGAAGRKMFRQRMGSDVGGIKASAMDDAWALVSELEGGNA